jgi:hypothetical protein
VASDLLNWAETVGKVLNNMATGDETWVCGCDSETKQQSRIVAVADDDDDDDDDNNNNNNNTHTHTSARKTSDAQLNRPTD